MPTKNPTIKPLAEIKMGLLAAVQQEGVLRYNRECQTQMTDSQRTRLDTLSDHLQAATALTTELRNEQEGVKLKPSPPAVRR